MLLCLGSWGSVTSRAMLGPHAKKYILATFAGPLSWVPQLRLGSMCHRPGLDQVHNCGQLPMQRAAGTHFHFVTVLLTLCADPVDRLQLQLQDLTRRERELTSQLEMLQTAA